ncbi:hypothetical protein [Streptomyces fractus]|uniref:hypothetical protein n=1 Tax=Streptomyces fractus TaxID=641806 RepID=UPI003CE68FEA
MPTSTEPLLQALTLLWERLRGDVPELPVIRPVVSHTPRSSDHRPSWTRTDDGAVAGLVINADTLQAGAEALLTSVLHDAVHVLNWQRDVKDVASRGIYHNASFLTAAEEVGLEWPEGAGRSGGTGYADVALTDAARERHASDLATLPEVIEQALPHIALPAKTRRATDRLTLSCQCTPPRKFRMSRTVAAQGPVICGVCSKEFTAD